MVDQIDVEGLREREETASGSAGYSALPGLVRELIRTPAFKELLLLHLRDIDPDNASELVKTLVWEDVGFSMGVLGTSPQLINWMAQALIELGVQLSNFTTDILKDFIGKLGEDIDTEKLKSVPSAYAPLVNDLVLEDREALDAIIAGLGSLAEEIIAATERTWRKIWNTADFGKIRVGLTAYLEGRSEELTGEPETFNPVAISNLLGVAAPLANFLLRVLTRTVQSLDLPSEILANAVFQLLEDIDHRELGGLVNAICDAINSLHRGNLLLGRDEPRFKEVVTRISRELVDGVDGERLKAAALAVGEDSKVIGEVISSYLFATPDSTVEVVKAVHTALNAALRTVAETSRRLSELPPGAMGELASDIGERFEARELGRILNRNMVLFNKLQASDPEFLSGILIKTFSAVEPQVWADASKTAALQVKDAVLAAPQVSAALAPEAIGRDINAGLVAFNRFAAENPELIVDRVSETMAVVDTYELSRAVERMMALTTRALTHNTKVLMAVVKPVTIGMFKAVGAMVSNIGPLKRLKERKASGGRS
jgi:hypothetical protein